MNPNISFAFVVAVSLTSATMCASALELESKATKTHLLELYTSEGCSSCPPAEAWFSRLKSEAGLWQDFVPLAFHVDYWDRLGWRDPFASKQWTARQYAYAARWQNSSVYTPGFVLDGREYREEHSVPVSSKEEAGVLRVTGNDDVLRVSFAPADNKARNFEVHVARLGFDSEIDVKAGENRGRKLKHDFVVLALASGRLENGKSELRLPSGPARRGREALAVWVTQVGQVEPLQAVGGWL